LTLLFFLKWIFVDYGLNDDLIFFHGFVLLKLGKSNLHLWFSSDYFINYHLNDDLSHIHIFYFSN